MAFCIDCGSRISAVADICPRCNKSQALAIAFSEPAPVVFTERRSFLRRGQEMETWQFLGAVLAAVALGLALGFVLFGGGDDAPDVTAPEPVAPITTVAPAPVATTSPTPAAGVPSGAPTVTAVPGPPTVTAVPAPTPFGAAPPAAPTPAPFAPTPAPGVQTPLPQQ